MEHWQRVKDSLKSLKRGHENEEKYPPKQVDIKYESVEILTLHSSIRAWTDWKADLERMWRGAAWKYHTDDLKVIKATSKMDRACRARWTSYLRNTPEDEDSYPRFLEWTRTLIKDNVNFESTVYEQYQGAVQGENQSPLDFDAYLSAVERELPDVSDNIRANIFYSKLHENVRKQIKLSGMSSLPTTRTEMVSLAQRMWEALRQDGRVPSKTRNSNSHSRHQQGQTSEQGSQNQSQQSNTRGGHRGRYRGGYRGRGGGRGGFHNGHTSRSDNTDVKNKDNNETSELVCYNCGKPGHFRGECPEKERPARVNHKRKAPEDLTDSSEESGKE